LTYGSKNGLKEGLRRKSLRAKNGSFFGIGGNKPLSMEKRKIVKHWKVKQKEMNPNNCKN
jgi:hypothetical protein